MSKEWTMYNGQAMPKRIVDTADEAYGCGQPYMDNLVMVLMDKGACTPAQNVEFMRLGMLRDAVDNVCLTTEERQRVWQRYDVPWWRRCVYRFRAWRNVRRVMAEGQRG